MPCQSEGPPAPTAREREARLVDDLLIFIHKAWFPHKGLPPRIYENAASDYPSDKHIDEDTAALCGLLNSAPAEKRDALVYNARNAMSRKLADWWEMHQERDSLRIERETQQRKELEDVERAKAKLTPEEISLLRKYWNVN